MRTIEVYHHVGPESQLISRMWFLNEKDLRGMATRLMVGLPFNSERRDRHEVCQLVFISTNGFQSGYYTDGMPSVILNICTEYALFYGYARKLAESNVWQFAWKYATPEWRQKTILRHMQRATKLLRLNT